MVATDKPAWQMSRAEWHHRHGVHIPWIAEISPYQYSTLSNRARQRYDAKRDAEWQAVEASALRWRAAIEAAWQAGEVAWQTEGVSPDARDVLFALDQAARAAAARQEQADRRAANQIRDTSGLAVGDRLWATVYNQDVTVERVNRTSVGVRFRDGTRMRLDVRMLLRQRPGSVLDRR